MNIYIYMYVYSDNPFSLCKKENLPSVKRPISCRAVVVSTAWVKPSNRHWERYDNCDFLWFKYEKWRFWPSGDFSIQVWRSGATIFLKKSVDNHAGGRSDPINRPLYPSISSNTTRNTSLIRSWFLRSKQH